MRGAEAALRGYEPPPAPDLPDHRSGSLIFFSVCKKALKLLGDNVPVTRNQCWGSVTFWCGSGSADRYLWLANLAPDPTIFFSDFKDANNKKFINIPSGTLSSVLKIKFFAKILF
jgi:hypothetical protein